MLPFIVDRRVVVERRVTTVGGDLGDPASYVKEGRRELGQSPRVPRPSEHNVLLRIRPSEGQFERASGIVLADVGPAPTRYLFGSTGHADNRPYRRLAQDGSAPSWTALNGGNDSGTGFRIALGIDGSRLFHIDVENVIRAYSTETDPGGVPIWARDGDGVSPGLAHAIKVGPDGRIYGHWHGTAALDPLTGVVVWQSAGDLEGAIATGAFWDAGTHVQYVVAGTQRSISAYDIASPTGSGPIWSYVDTEGGGPSPTIDPSTGSIYVFRTSRVIKLTASGAFVWSSDPVPADEQGVSSGALSRDGETFYYQTGGISNNGRL